MTYQKAFKRSYLGGSSSSFHIEQAKTKRSRDFGLTLHICVHCVRGSLKIMNKQGNNLPL